MITLIVMLVSVFGCYGSYILGCRDAMKKAGVVVKKDDRIIECNGLASPLMCKECCFSRVHVDGEKWSVECFAPDYDGVPTIGLRKMKEEKPVYGLDGTKYMQDEDKQGWTAE